MSAHRIRMRIEMMKIDERGEVDALETNLKGIPTLEIHELGLSEVEVSFDQAEVDTQSIRQAVEQAGGAVRNFQRVE